MDKLINKETGLEYSNTDPSLHFNTVEKVDNSWRNEYLKLLTDRDYEAAHELRSRNDPKYKQATADLTCASWASQRINKIGTTFRSTHRATVA